MPTFTKQPLHKPNFFQRILKITPKKNVLIEINNLLADNNADLIKVTKNDIIQLAEKYKVNLKRAYKKERLRIFYIYLKYAIEDQELSSEEIYTLNHLRFLLFLSENDTKQLLEEEQKRVYDSVVKEVVADGRLDTDEENRLKQLKKALLIPENVAEEIYSRNAGEVLQQYLSNAVSDERLSVEEESEMHAIAKSLNLELKIDHKTQQTLNRYRLLWQIENGDLPVLKADINLQRGELLHFQTKVDWRELRRVTSRVNYSGPTARIKIMKGVYYRAGSMSVNRVSEDVWKTIDSGDLYLANKRLIFMGLRGNKNIRLSGILDVNPFSNGVDIQKSTGKSPFLQFNNGTDIFTMILVRLLEAN